MQVLAQVAGRARGNSGPAAFSCFVLFVFLVVLSRPVWPQDSPPPPTGTARLEGRVLGSDGEPAAYAGVAVIELKRGTTTDEAGRFILDRLPVGHWTLRFSSVAFGQITRTIEIGTHPPAPLEVRFQEG